MGRAQHLCKTTLFDFPLCARRTGFSHRVGALWSTRLRPFALPRSYPAIIVPPLLRKRAKGRSLTARLRPFAVDRNVWHFLWYGVVAGDGLRSVGADGELPIQERVLYPAHRHLRAGVLRGSGLYTVLRRAFRIPPLGAAFALRPVCVARDLGWCDHVCTRWGGHNSSNSIRQLFRARRTGFYHRVGATTSQA